MSNNYKKFEIETKSTADNDPNYKIDLKNFIKTPSDIELANIDSSWYQNLAYKISKSDITEVRKYKF